MPSATCWVGVMMMSLSIEVVRGDHVGDSQPTSPDEHAEMLSANTAGLSVGRLITVGDDHVDEAVRQWDSLDAMQELDVGRTGLARRWHGQE